MIDLTHREEGKRGNTLFDSGYYALSICVYRHYRVKNNSPAFFSPLFSGFIAGRVQNAIKYQILLFFRVAIMYISFANSGLFRTLSPHLPVFCPSGFGASSFSDELHEGGS